MASRMTGTLHNATPIVAKPPKQKREPMFRKYLRRLLVWALPELAGHTNAIASLKDDLGRVGVLEKRTEGVEQKLNSILDVLTQWNDYHIHIYLQKVEAELRGSIKENTEDIKHLKGHRERFETTLANHLAIFKKMGRA